MRESAPSTYDPINVYKALAPNIGIVDGPFEYLSIAGIRLPLPFTTRMTVVRLANGDLFLHSPIAFNAALAEDLRSRGAIRHLVSPNQFHYAHIGEWADAFPDAIAWGSAQAQKRAQSRRINVRFTTHLSDTAPAEWKEEIDQTLVPGGIFKEFAFFHMSSKTLILTDSIMNIELHKINPAMAVRYVANRHASSFWSGFLRYAFAAVPTMEQDEDGVREDSIMAAGAHRAKSRALPGRKCRRNGPADIPLVRGARAVKIEAIHTRICCR